MRSPLCNSIKKVSIPLLLVILICLFTETMKVHPAVPRKRNISFHYDINSEANRIINRQKKLRRLPHIFNKVLELPFHSDADVLVQETPESFRFVVTTDVVGDAVRTHTIEIYPGVTKLVLRGGNVLDLGFDYFDLDLWRFRLPPSTKPELATVGYVDGDLVVTVPKDEVWGGGGSLFLVQ